jgi:hypothetical protein
MLRAGGGLALVSQRTLRGESIRGEPEGRGSLGDGPASLAGTAGAGPATDVPRHRWHQFVEDCRAFVNSEQLVHRAAELGWNAMALFGCWPNYPLSYLGRAGLLWHLNGGRIAELHRDWAVIDRPVNRSQRIFYRRDVDQDKIALPWTLPLVKTG